MANYNPQRFASMYSKRTKANLDYITNIVESRNKSQKFHEQFMNNYSEIFNYISSVEGDITNDVSLLKKESVGKTKKSKDEYLSKLYSIRGKLQDSRNKLQSELSNIGKTNDMVDDKLFEVTQLLNSLTGIAVLPYEMYKDILDPYKNSEMKDSLRETDEYANLYKFIKKVKHKSTYDKDKEEKNIVFSFLRHVRNAVCHSGDDALGILPLDGGEVIDKIIFYDKWEDKDKINLQEFAMKLTLDEVQELVELVSAFYECSFLENIDKTEKLKKAEARVDDLLGE